jgi:hypothetical protein
MDLRRLIETKASRIHSSYRWPEGRSWEAKKTSHRRSSDGREQGARLAGERDPRLRARAPRERLITVWLGRPQEAELKRTLDEFASQLAGLEAPKVEQRSAAPVPAELHELSHG